MMVMFSFFGSSDANAKVLAATKMEKVE